MKRPITLGLVAAIVVGLAYYANFRYQPFNTDAISIPETNCSYFRVPSRIFPARVVAVPDSDDVHVECKDVAGGLHVVRVRLAEIDCPEFGQPYYEQARNYTFDQAFSKGNNPVSRVQ
jgi:hypothetical protein